MPAIYTIAAVIFIGICFAVIAYMIGFDDGGRKARDDARRHWPDRAKKLRGSTEIVHRGQR